MFNLIPAVTVTMIAETIAKNLWVLNIHEVACIAIIKHMTIRL
jgi:hypothetical protein